MHIDLRIHKDFHENARVLYAIAPEPHFPASVISFISRFRQHIRVYTVHSRMSGRRRNVLITVRSRNFPGGSEEKSENLSGESPCSDRDSSISLKRCLYTDPLGHNSII
jgi:hypothetical protein